MVNENGKEKMIELILFLRIVFSTSFLVSIFSLLVLCFLMRSRSDEKRNKQVENIVFGKIEIEQKGSRM